MRKVDIVCNECGKVIGRLVCEGNNFFGSNTTCIKSIRTSSEWTYTYAEVACLDCEEKIGKRLNP